MNDKNGKNGQKTGQREMGQKAPETEKEERVTLAHQTEAEGDTLIKALKAEWRKAGSKPMTDAQKEEIKKALDTSKLKQAAAAKAAQDAADALSHAIGLIVRYSGQTTVTLDGKRQIIGCRGKVLFLRGMPVFDEGVTI